MINREEEHLDGNWSIAIVVIHCKAECALLLNNRQQPLLHSPCRLKLGFITQHQVQNRRDMAFTGCDNYLCFVRVRYLNSVSALYTEYQ